MATQYDFQAVEEAMYTWWEASGYFKPIDEGANPKGGYRLKIHTYIFCYTYHKQIAPDVSPIPTPSHPRTHKYPQQARSRT